MDLRQLEYFVAVAEEANFTRAAERVHISQSGVSAQVRQLERELGADLFDRSGRVARLTAAGEAAIGPARAALDAAAAVREAVDEVNQVLRGRLAVGMVTACTVTPLFDALAAFHERHPNIGLALSEDGSDRLVDGVRDGELDLALVGVAQAPPPDLESLPLVDERLVAAVPADHPLAGRTRLRLAQLARHPLVCLPTGTGIRTALDRACAARGVEPVIALQASAPDAVADLARRGLGVAVLSESMVVPGSGLHAMPISDADVPALLALVWRPSPRPALRELLTACREAFAPAPAVSARRARRARA